MGRFRNRYILVLFLAAAHLLYVPAWQAGWVRDVTGWLETLHTQSFPDYLLRRGLRVESLYPFTQFMLWFWWKLFGIHPLPWHVLMVSLHALCAWGWMVFYRQAIGTRYRPAGRRMGFMAGAFLLLSPYATEVVVWEAGYHYLQGMALLLATLFATLRFVKSGKRRWAMAAVLAFVPTLFALESFYLAPLYVAGLLLWLRPRYPAGVHSGMRWILLPLVALCVVQYVLFRMLYTQPVSHITTLSVRRMSDYLRKPGKYTFHLVLFGRYWPEGVQQMVYRMLNSLPFLGLFYGGLLVLFIRRGRHWLSGFWESPLALPVLYALGALALVMPLFFREGGLVDFDRYAYFLLPAVGALLGGLIPQRAFLIGWLAMAAVLLFYTNLLWRQSDALMRRMLATLPDFKDGRTTLLLNTPNSLKGVPMTGMIHEGETALMRRTVFQKPLHNLSFEPAAANLHRLEDAVVIRQEDTRTVEVTLPNRQGWWMGGVLGTDWENEWFAVQFSPGSHTYRLSLKKPAGQYHLLFWQDGQWHEWMLR